MNIGKDNLIMSIANIKNLFCKRVQESVAFQTGGVLENNFKCKNEVEEKDSHFLKESDVGITEYLNNCKGFSGVIKHRFSDFHVHEIDMDGNVVYLNCTEIPEVEIEPVKEDVLTNEIWENLKNLSNKVVESVEIDVTDFSKEKRRDIHKAIKYKYGSLFTSNTIQVDEKKKLVVSLGKDSKRDAWFGELGKYLHFVLFKKNLDTVNAISILASHLRTKASNLTYAGTKDKRGNTSQWVSMWHLDAKKLKRINDSLRDMKVGNFTYKNTPLKLGDLKGNFFEIALRNVTESDDIINSALKTFKENGFINYFGLQRFGNSIEIPTYEIGRALVKADFKLAVELILKPRKGMKNDLKEARQVWWETRDADKAYKCLKSKDRTIEGKLLLGLAKHGKNAYVNALDCLPRNVRLLYMHSYQSYLWNKILSRRIKEFGKAVIEGDLVYVKEDTSDSEKDNEILETQERNFENELDSEKCEPIGEVQSVIDKPVKYILQEDLDKYNIYDIVHPLPGYNVIYPNNVIKEWYNELLTEENLTSEKFKQTVNKYSLSGRYRHIVKNVKDLSWHMCKYSEPEEDLILSDLDKMNSSSLQINEHLTGNYKAVILKFSLDSSTYATMALREILKIDTSCSYQAALSKKRFLNSEENDESRKKKKI